MISLFRILYRNFFVNGIPLHQLLIGIILVPAGSGVSWAALFADPYHFYPYFAIAGILFAVLGLLLIGKGLLGLINGKPAQQGMHIQPYTGQVQPPYAGQPYAGQVAQPYAGQVQPPYAGPQPYAGQVPPSYAPPTYPEQ